MDAVTGRSVESGGGQPPPALAVEGLRVTYGGVVAVENVSLSVRAGEVCGLIGPNGAGKTTLFDVISGVRRPVAGRVTIQGRAVTSWSAVRRARVGLRRTFQSTQVFQWLSVAENLRVASDWRGGEGPWHAKARVAMRSSLGLADRELDARLISTLEMCGLADLRDQPAGSLPIGASRMVEFARAVADGPSVLLLDEPTSGLDHEQMDRLEREINKIRHETSCAVLLVEHDVEFVMRLCDRIVALELGRVIATGTPDEIRRDPIVRAAYLGGA